VNDDEVTRLIMKETRLSVRPLGIAGLRTLAEQARWTVETITGQVFRLVK
jgi:hypothetical protein